MIPAAAAKKRNVNLHDVLMYVAIARKHLRLMILLMATCLMAGLVYYVYAREVFYTKALVRTVIVPLPGDDEKLYGDDALPDVIRGLHAAHIIERTGKKLGIGGSSREIQLKHVLKTTIRPNAQKHLEISVDATSRDLAKKWAETLVAEFLAFRREKRVRDRDELMARFQADIDLMKENTEARLDKELETKSQTEMAETNVKFAQLRNVPFEKALAQRRVDSISRAMINLNSPSLTPIEKLSIIASLNEDRMSTANLLGAQPAQPSDGAEKLEGAAAPAGSSPAVVVIPEQIEATRSWEALEKEQRAITDEIAMWTAKGFKYGHAKIVELNKRLEEVTRQLESEVSVAVKRLDVEHKQLIARVVELQEQLDQLVAVQIDQKRKKANFDLEVGAKPNYSQIATNLQRQMEYLMLRDDNARVHLSFQNLIDVRDAPVSPNRLKLAVMSLLFGLVVSVGVPFLIEYLDHTLTNLDQVETTFNLRGLGIVPKVEGDTTPVLLKSREASEGNLIENFRVIRTNLLSMGTLSKAPHVLMVTSSMPKEGKTVVSSNLAASFASMGEKTLLIDTDLRRGRLHRLFGYRKNPGVSNVLLGEVPLEDALRPTALDNLTVMTAGRHLDTGAEILGSEKFEAMLQELRGRFDRVIVDTPPVLGLSETSILQKFVDGVLFVIWSGNTPIRSMKAAIDILNANGANFYGFVLNRLDLNATTNYYQYYYYSYDYYYHYTPKAIEQA